MNVTHLAREVDHWIIVGLKKKENTTYDLEGVGICIVSVLLYPLKLES